jgi:hypothetical protein
MTTDLARAIDRLEDEAELLYERRAGKVDPYAPGVGYEDDPVGFIEKRLVCALTPTQREVALSVLREPRTAVPGHHGAGKDHLAARLALWWAYARRGLVVMTAATERQLLGILVRRELRSALLSGRLSGELFANRLVVDGSDRLVAFPSSSVSSMTGWHDERVLVVISEGQGESVEASAYDAAFGMVTNEESRIVVVGNPIAPSGRFYDVCHSPSWRVVRMSAFDHPNIVTGERVIPGGPDRSWVDSIEAEYGRESDYFRSRVEALFPTQAVDSLIPRAWLDAAVGREVAA